MARWFQAGWAAPAAALLLGLIPPPLLPAAPSFGAVGSPGTVTSPYITEASGLAVSRQNPGVLWTHNDSTFPGSLFALSTNGTVLARHILPVGNNPAYDAEDLALGPGPDPARHYLYLGDIGDNTATRASIRVFRLPEPAIYPDQPFQLTYPPGVQPIVLTYPDGPHNAEAMMIDPIHGDLYIVTKAVIGSAGLYRAPAASLAAGGPVMLSLVRPVGFLKVSAGDISPDGRLLLLRSGNNAAVWSRAVRQSIGDALGTPAAAAPVFGEPLELNGEAVAFDPAARGYFTLGEGLNQPLFAFRRTDAAAPAVPVHLVAPGETWRFQDDGSDLGSAWRDTAYDDHAWSQGRGQLGYGQGDERTLLRSGSDPANKPITTYFRRTFLASAADRSNRLVLRLCYTDGAAVYLNGTEILRRHLAPAAAFNTPASGSNNDLQNAWSWFPVDPALLVPGTNLLAVELHRFSPAGPSLSFDAQLVSRSLDHAPDGTDPGEPPDATPPAVTISSPAALSVVTNETLLVRGTARDNVGLARVEWRLGDGPLQPVTGLASWSVALPMAVGTNLLSVIATDFRTNTAPAVTRAFIRRAVSPITVQTQGPGTVFPVLNGLPLLVGQAYTLTATPAPQHLFAGWDGGLTSATSRLTFLMESNLLLRAHFVTNPFRAAKGAYRGLLEHNAGPAHERSGPISVTVAESGAFSARLRLGATTAALSGRFDLAGRARVTVSPAGQPASTLALALELAPGGHRLSGTFDGPGWSSTLLAHRPPVFSAAAPSPWTGRWTLRIAGPSNGPATGPAGHGVAALAIAPTGVGTLSGSLADGTRLAQASPVSADGLWALAPTVYGNRGSLLGWLSLTNAAPLALQGSVAWVRPADPLALPFPAGFTNATFAEGAPYQPTHAAAWVAPHCLTLRGLDGSPEPLTRCPTTTLSSLTLAGEGFRSLQLAPSSGLWSGVFTNPATLVVHPVRFTLLGTNATGYGHILGTEGSAAVETPR
jgi:hypothetical protein